MGSRAVPQGRDRTSVRRMGVAVSVHGFRAAFSTWASERTAYPVEVRESALGHIIGSAVSRAYARSDLLAPAPAAFGRVGEVLCGFGGLILASANFPK